MAINYFYDRLYGQIPFDNNDLRILRTPEMIRLREVSHSATPPWVLTCGLCAHKGEHSFGARHLGKIATEPEEFADVRQDILFAIWLHDVGTPPFSHMSEYFLKLLLDKDHEEYAEDVLLNSILGEEVVRQGGNLPTITQIIKGRARPASDMVNGTIDLDNLDTSLRYCVSMGLVTYPPYRPEVLARSYRRGSDGTIYLDESALPELPGWEECRERTYSFVYSEHNLKPNAMLHRAMDLASREGVDQIPPEFFRFTDPQAYDWLLTRCNPKTVLLAEHVRNFQWYQLAFSQTTTEEIAWISEQMKVPRSRGLLADELADLIAAPPEAVCAYFGQNKGFKQIHLDVRDSCGTIQPIHRSMLQNKWYVRVFIAPEYNSSMARETIKKHLEQMLSL